MNSEKKYQGIPGVLLSSAYFARIFYGIGLILAFTFLTMKCFAHVHIEVEISEQQWDQIEKDLNKQAYDKVNDDPGDASKEDRARAYQHEDDNRV